jgi:hypothetical protein
MTTVLIRDVALAAVLLSCPILPSRLSAQASVPDTPVRVTVRDSVREQRIIGMLLTATSKSLVLRAEDTDSILTFERANVVRVEIQPSLSIGKAALAGCLFLGGALALAGSGVHDPDSPGIERIAALLGFVVGCGVGGGAGALLTIWSGSRWQEITV